ncbi:ABC transporter substrate-binding protein [Thalassotalea sediminis]|uniref:ABC transporter substrate-binding protein n=1 Tax=Thalassotalea sediminis TaxID=1759089 RepID=UPI00257423C5|nr:extracellular solute-binding protein [Thalassotalea sediminis]
MIIKRFYWFQLLIWCCLLSLNSAPAKAEKEVLTFAMMGFSKVKEQIYRDQINAFEQEYPQYKVRMVKLISRSYPELLAETLALKDKIDVINWFAGDRLHSLVKEDMLVSLSHFWQTHDLEQQFNSATKSAVTYNGEVYGVPITSYVWGFYYKKALFKRLSLKEPQNWQGFLDVLERLKAERIAPIALGSRYPWQIAGWFDYITLRLHGEKIYREIVKGNRSFKSPEVLEVFKYWRELLTNEYFFPQHKFYDGEELMPLLYREVVGVNLIGTFVLSSLPEHTQKEIGYFAFPQMGTRNNNSVLAPLSLIALTKQGQQKKSAMQLVSFFTLPSVQRKLNENFYTFSPIKGIGTPSNELMSSAYQTLLQAEYQSQYFDIEMQFEMAEYAKEKFAEFIEHYDIDKVTSELESKRKQLFSIEN